MPAPYKTAEELLTEARTLNIDPLFHILNTADRYEWTEPHTVAVLHAIQRHTRPNPNHQPTTWPELRAIMDETDPTPTPTAHRTPTQPLETAVANYLSHLWAAQQTADEFDIEACEAWESELARLVGLPDPHQGHPAPKPPDNYPRLNP